MSRARIVGNINELPPLEWFGPAWDGPLCASRPRSRTPVGDRCESCRGIITYSARGVLVPGAGLFGVRLAPFHLRCFRRSNAPGSDEV